MGLAQAHELLAFKLDRAATGLNELDQRAAQGAFARTRFTHQAQRFTRRNVKADAAHGAHTLRTAAKLDREIFNTNHGRGHALLSRWHKRAWVALPSQGGACSWQAGRLTLQRSAKLQPDPSRFMAGA